MQMVVNDISIFKNGCRGIRIVFLFIFLAGCQDENEVYYSKPVSWPIGDAYGYHWEGEVEEWSRMYKIRVFGDRDYVQAEKIFLSNNKLGIKEDLADIIIFPQRDGSFKAIGKHRIFDSDITSDTSIYSADFDIKVENNELLIEVTPREEYSGLFWQTYTNCGYLTGHNEVAYINNFLDQPKSYYGKYDIKINKFVISKVDAPLKYIYRARWDRSEWDDSGSYSKKKHINEARALVFNNEKIGIICNEDQYFKAKDEYKNSLDSIFLKKERAKISRLAPEIRASLRRENCDGTGIRFPDDCLQLMENSFLKKMNPRFKWKKYTKKLKEVIIIPEH